MKINWNNVFAACLGLAAIVLFLRHRHEVSAFLATVKRIGPGHSPEDMTLGLIVIGICGAVLVAIVRLLTQNRRD
ncbi:MAG: hypothetical protein HY298_20735 [Verrucomicrobia bacterium]|nr:hypothetical protein [Verrucomicrobiota bacterium]